MNEGQFFLALILMIPALYFTMKGIVWFAEKIEKKK
jgi:hypothetical protein|tara:strand:+ start:1123 stop:1230 length:108 start_codon:yes stop_codon:yes gene_type:complete